MPQIEWTNQIDKVIVLAHKEKEKARFQRLERHLLEAGIPPDRLAFCAPTWGDQLSSQQIFQVYDPWCRQGIQAFTFKARCLSKGEISLVLNFAAAARLAVEQGWQTVVILESDIWLRYDFVSRLKELLSDLQGKDWDYVSLGEGARTRPPKCEPSLFAPTKAYVPPHQWVFRCTDSMLFRVSFLSKILTTLFPFRECLDWELNLQSMIHKAKCWWADPPLAEQGTGVGREETTLVA